jgi:hypothetical protein
MRCPILSQVFLSLGLSAALASSPSADESCAAFTFVALPGKKAPNEGESYAGLTSLTVETGGVYRS